MPICLFCLFWFDILPQINGSTITPIASASGSSGNKVVVSGSPINNLRSETYTSTDDAGAGSSGSCGGGGNILSSSATGTGANVGKVSFTEQVSTSSISFDNTGDAQAAGIYIGETGANRIALIT